MTLEEKIEALTKNFEYLQAQNEEKEAQNNYLRRQLDAFMKEKRRNLKRAHPLQGDPVLPGQEKKMNPLLMVHPMEMTVLGFLGGNQGK